MQEPTILNEEGSMMCKEQAMFAFDSLVIEQLDIANLSEFNLDLSNGYHAKIWRWHKMI